MRPPDILSLESRCLHLIALCIFIVFLDGCASTSARFPPGHLETGIEGHDLALAREDEVIGELAVIRLEKGDTLPDIARHFGLGINAVRAANPGVDVWVPPVGERVTLPLNFVLPDGPRKGIVVNLAAMRLFHYKATGNSLLVATYPVGAGVEERPAASGEIYVERKATRESGNQRKKGDPIPAEIPPGPQNGLREYALYLSKSPHLIQGTNNPATVGLRATHAGFRLYPEHIKKLFDETPVNTPVAIVDQPYLVGQRDGVVYLEAHKPIEDTGTGAIEQEKLYLKLSKLERDLGRTIDWRRVKTIVAEARGIPVPILETKPRTRVEAAETAEIPHPRKLYGSPEVPELKKEGWYVLADYMLDETDASRTAAIINHQGQQIPARVLLENNDHCVIAGPFNDATEAKNAARRLKIDFELDAILMEPVKENL